MKLGKDGNAENLDLFRSRGLVCY